MITIGDLEYEPEQTKNIYLAEQTVALFAGDISCMPPSCQGNGQIRETVAASGNILVEEIAEFYALEFSSYRRSRAERVLLTPLNLNTESFLAQQTQMLPDIAVDLTNKLVNSDVGSEAIRRN